MRKVDAGFIRQIEGGQSCLALPAPAGKASLRKGPRTLSPSLAYILAEVERELGTQSGQGSAEEIIPSNAELEATVLRVAARLGLELANFERDEILAYLEKEQRPFGILQELVDDTRISDIIVTNYQKIEYQQGRSNYQTDLAFPSAEAYETFVERLLIKAGATYSTKKPIADGMLGAFARVHVVHKALCESGPYLTIRLNRFSAVSVGDLTRGGMAPQPVFDYLTALVRAGCTLMLVGEVGTGKTTLARALAASVPGDESILVIEDTPEIKLEHPHVRYVTTREANTDGAGRVTPSECIRAGMRMAMNRIIFGEIRDAEAAEAFIDVCASGHPGLSTVHARSTLDAVARLELFLGRAQRGVSSAVASEQIAMAVQAMVYVDICKATGLRRIMEVREIGPVADGVMRSREIFRYQLNGEIPGWRVVNRVSAHRDELESDANPVRLSAYPAVIEPGFDELYRHSSAA